MGLFSDDDDSDKCPVQDLTVLSAKTFIASFRFQQFNEILAGACTVIACLVSFYHLFNHATHLSLPRQQVKVMRVVALVPLYSIINLLCICFPTASVYIMPVLDLFQSLCLASYLLLLCEYLSPDRDGRDAFFARIEIEDKKAEGGKVQDTVKWFWKQTFMIFQYPVLSLAIVIATIITQAVGIYCQFDSKTNYARLYLQIVNALSSGLAIGAIIGVAVSIKKEKPELKPIHKLIAIKLVVGLAFLQQILFWILQSFKVLKPNDTLTYADLHIGIPSLLSCIEMVPISFVIMWAYPVGPYRLENAASKKAERGETHDYAASSYQGGAGGIRAFIDMVNPIDIIKAITVAFSFAIQERMNQRDSSRNEYYSMSQQTSTSQQPLYNQQQQQQYQYGQGHMAAPQPSYNQSQMGYQNTYGNNNQQYYNNRR